MDDRLTRIEEQLLLLDRRHDDLDAVIRDLDAQVGELRRHVRRLEASLGGLAREAEEGDAAEG